MTLIRNTPVALSALLLAATAQARIVDIDAKTSVGTRLDLAAGDYQLSFAGNAAGVGFQAWNPGASAAARGWVDNFSVDVGGVTRRFAAVGSAYPDPDAVVGAQANGLFEVSDDGSLALAATRTLQLDTAAHVTFFIDDRYYADNVGGVSISIDHVPRLPGGPESSSVPTPAPIPEPPQYALLLAGLGVIGLVAARRCRA